MEHGLPKEYAAGAVIYRKERGILFFLLVYSVRNGIWGFPKGHVEEGEDETTAARREIAEETGLRRLSLLDGFREEDVYEAQSTRERSRGRRIEKHSVYYVAEAREAAITADNDEIGGYRWLPLPQALALLPFDSLRSILTKAHAFVRAGETAT